MADKLQIFFCILNLILQEDVITLLYFIDNETGNNETHYPNIVTIIQAHIVTGSQIIKLTHTKPDNAALFCVFFFF